MVDARGAFGCRGAEVRRHDAAVRTGTPGAIDAPSAQVTPAPPGPTPTWANKAKAKLYKRFFHVGRIPEAVEGGGRKRRANYGGNCRSMHHLRQEMRRIITLTIGIPADPSSQAQRYSVAGKLTSVMLLNRFRLPYRLACQHRKPPYPDLQTCRAPMRAPFSPEDLGRVFDFAHTHQGPHPGAAQGTRGGDAPGPVDRCGGGASRPSSYRDYHPVLARASGGLRQQMQLRPVRLPAYGGGMPVGAGPLSGAAQAGAEEFPRCLSPGIRRRASAPSVRAVSRGTAACLLRLDLSGQGQANRTAGG